MKSLIYIAVSAMFLQSCVPNNGYYNRRGAVSVVSATRSTGEYISRGHNEYSSYVSALEAAKLEDAKIKQKKVYHKDPIDEYIAGLSKEPYANKISDINYENKASNIEYSPIVKKSLSKIWGKPVGSVGEGVTLLNEVLRSRFNDALGTTPVSSKARWKYGEHKFIFMPNSDIFQPYYSGGNCRDGVFVNYIDGNEERVRGLFCQKGRGADWYLMR